MESPATPLPLDKASVTGPARRALGRATAEVTDWQCTLLHGGYSGAGVYRVAGHAHDHGTVVAWVLVLKVVDAPRADSPVPVMSQYLAQEETLAPWGTN